MTMLDDQRLASLFGRTAATFDVPASGMEDIVDRAAGRVAGGDDGGDGGSRGSGDDHDGGAGSGGPPTVPVRAGRARLLRAAAGRHRVLTVAASILVLLVVTSVVGALVRGPARSTLTSGLPRSTTVAPLHGATTTVPTTTNPSGATSASPDLKASGGAGVAPAPATTTPTAPTLPSGSVGQSTKIQQTGSLQLAVGRGLLGRTIAQLGALAGANGGFVASSQTQSGAGAGGAPYGSITLQVPVDNFTTVLAGAERLGKTSGLTTKATDVTGQYVDLQERIAALEASRQQYLTIMTKATSIGDILAVQAQLDTIQSQIEQLQGQLQVLTGETSYSTLEVTVSEGSGPPRPAPRPESGLARAWHASIGGFVAGVEGVVRLAGPVLFALLCLALVLVGGRALWRRYQRHNL